MNVLVKYLKYNNLLSKATKADDNITLSCKSQHCATLHNAHPFTFKNSSGAYQWKYNP